MEDLREHLLVLSFLTSLGVPLSFSFSRCSIKAKNYFEVTSTFLLTMVVGFVIL